MTAPRARGARDARELAFLVLRDVFGPDARGAQASFNVHASRSALDARDRAFAAELAYGTIKMRRLLDWYLAPFLAARAKPLPLAIAEILRLGAYQLRLSVSDPHAAVYETVNLASRHGHRGTSGLVNAVLRRLAAGEPAQPEAGDFDDPDDFVATRGSLPTWLAAHWRVVFGAALERIVAGVNAAPQRAITVNALRADVAAVAAELGGTRSPHVADSLILEAGAIGDDAAGRWSVQSESAAMPGDVLAPRPGEEVLELCAGRGNKTLQMAARMDDRGALYAVEIDRAKVAHWRRALERCGVSCATMIEGDARTVEVPEVDAALVDAPCSGLGIVGRHPEARWRKSPGDGARLAPLQGALLRAAARRLRPGGRLVYSVCSSDGREGVEAVDAFLAEHTGFARGTLPARYAAFARAGDLLVPPGVEGRDGFFIALLERAA